MPQHQDQDRYHRKIKGLSPIYKASRREAKIKGETAYRLEGVGLETQIRWLIGEKMNIIKRFRIKYLKSRKRWHMNKHEHYWDLNDEQNALQHWQAAKNLAAEIEKLKGDTEFLWEW